MKVKIIAEAGVNHNGSLKLAKELALTAKECGVDFIKFQTFKAENLTSKFVKKAIYQEKNTTKNETQYEMLKKLELSYDDFIELNSYCKKININFLSTPFDLESVDFLKTLNMKFWKIPSGEITNLPLLNKIGEFKEKVILSTGMSNMKEISDAINILNLAGTKNITLLHCTTEYPAPYDEINLRAMQTMKNKFSLPIGYSDHTEGIEISLAAVSLGACIIEKHFTLDKKMEGPDHLASLNPKHLKKLVKSIRNIELSLGDGIKKPNESELKNILIARKSIVAKKNIFKGEILSTENITTKRPGSGISPMNWNNVIGKIAIKDFKQDELIEL